MNVYIRAGKLFHYIWYASIECNRNNLKIQTKIVGLKIRKKARGTPRFSLNFWPEKFCSNFQFILLELIEAYLKGIKTFSVAI